MRASASAGSEFDRLVGLIYDSAVAPSRLPGLLRGLADTFAAPFADSFSREHDGSHASGIVHGLDRADYEQGMLATWSSRNPWARKAPVMTAGTVRPTWQFLGRDELVGSEMYADYLRERGLHEGLRFEIWSDAVGIEDVSLLRSFAAGPFDDGEIALGRALMPHLQRAADLRRRLQWAELMADAGLAMLEASSQPVILIDRAARPVYVNAAAAALLARRDAILSVDRRLAAAAPKAARALDAVLARATLTDGRARAGTTLLPAAGSDRPLVALAMPLRRDDRDAAFGHPAAIVCFGQARSAVTDHALGPLAAIFGLTAAETRLAALLLSGHSVADIARTQSRSVATIRTHLARLMAKTDTTRQGELLLRLREIPGLPAHLTLD